MQMKMYECIKVVLKTHKQYNTSLLRLLNLLSLRSVDSLLTIPSSFPIQLKSFLPVWVSPEAPAAAVSAVHVWAGRLQRSVSTCSLVGIGVSLLQTVLAGGLRSIPPPDGAVAAIFTREWTATETRHVARLAFTGLLRVLCRFWRLLYRQSRPSL